MKYPKVNRMPKILFVDNRKSIVERVKEAGFAAKLGDYFIEALKEPRHVLMSASNPSFSYGGGIDRDLQYHFPLYCEAKQKRAYSGNERIGNIVFTITVDNRLASNEQLVREALKFAIENTDEGETLVLMGAGTGIGLLKEDVFVEILKEEAGHLINNYHDQHNTTMGEGV